MRRLVIALLASCVLAAPAAAAAGDEHVGTDEVIATETARNREAVLRLLKIADCPYRAIAKQAVYCPAAEPAPPPPPSPPPPPPPPPQGVTHRRHRRRRRRGRSRARSRRAPA